MRLVYLSPVPLTSFAQRPHHFVEWFHARHGGQVLWVDPYPARLPRMDDLRNRRTVNRTGLGPRWNRAPWIKRAHVPALPLEPLALGRLINDLLWQGLFRQLDAFIDRDTWIVAAKPCALAIEVFRRYAGHRTALDVMDNVPAFTSGLSRRWLQRAENELAERCDRIIVSSSALQARFERQHDKVICVRNGLTPPPSDMAATGLSRRTGSHVFGYVGAIASWFDWGATIDLARRFPGATIRLIGPVHGQIPRLPGNVELRPAIRQSQVYETLQEFSIGLIPFKLNALTEFVDPVKYYEYRAVGLPVLSSRFGEMRLRGQNNCVLFFDELRDAALPDWFVASSNADEIKAFRQDNCWGRRFDELNFFSGD